MNAAEVRRVLSELREAGRRLRCEPPDRARKALETLLDRWSAPDSPERQALVVELAAAAGFHEDTVRAGLDHGLARYRGEALRHLIRRELGDRAAGAAEWESAPLGFEVTALLLAGAIPMPTLLGIVAPLALGSPVLVKPGRHDPVTAERVAASLREIDPLVGRCVAVARIPRHDARAMEELLSADCVVANGSNETLAALAPRVPPDRRWVPYGHRISVAVIGPEASSGAAAERVTGALARDVALWDQLGCLSPQVVLLAGRDPGATSRWAEQLAEALEALGSRWPRGRMDPRAAAVAAHERAEAEMREAAGRRVRTLVGHHGTVIREEDARLRPAPGHRFVRVHPVAHLGELAAALQPLSRQLAAVALTGFGAVTARARAVCIRAGASRVCPPGHLQAPPLDWPRDNRPVLIPLARVHAMEGGGETDGPAAG